MLSNPRPVWCSFSLPCPSYHPQSGHCMCKVATASVKTDACSPLFIGGILQLLIFCLSAFIHCTTGLVSSWRSLFKCIMDFDIIVSVASWPLTSCQSPSSSKEFPFCFHVIHRQTDGQFVCVCACVQAHRPSKFHLWEKNVALLNLCSFI